VLLQTRSWQNESFIARKRYNRNRRRTVETMHTDQHAAFLVKYAPFDTLDAGELGAVAASAQERRYEPGETILIEDGLPAEQLYIVREGSVELMHDGESVDLLGPGETFGEPSLLSGLAPAFTVRARDETVCLLIPREQALALFSRPAGAAHLARTFHSRLVQTGYVVHAMPELGTISVGELITRPPLFCEGAITIRRAAELMTADHASAILVRDGENLSILTDAVLRARVVTGEISAESPVSRVVQAAVQVGPERIAVDAVVEMLDRGADHIAVVDSSRKVLGVLSASDLAGLETRSPFALRHAILSARDEEELAAAAHRMRALFLALLDAGIGPLDVGRVLALQVDSITSRLVELSIARRGPAPTAWAWLALGSTARREFTLGSDIENALAYDDGDTAADVYFAGVGEDVSRGLQQCGLSLDPNDVVASNPLWRMPASRWVETFQACLDSPDRSHLIRANVAFDFRQIAGGLEVAPPLVAVLRDAKNHPDFVRRIARSATDFKPPLGFRGSLVTSSSGGVTGVDLKAGGVIPIANMARFLALSAGVTISSTVGRLAAVREAGALDDETAAGLDEAFAILMRVRLEHHAVQLETGVPTDNIVDPHALPPLARAQLREAFRAIAAAQKLLSVYVPMGM
jgi:CBS domain-containing protein